MSAIEIINEMDAMDSSDIESAHSKADELILDFLSNHDSLSKDVAMALRRLKQRCGGEFLYS